MSRPVKNLVGQKFGRLTVLEQAGRIKHKAVHWLCRCDCGQQKVVRSNSLTLHNTESCGCLQRELSAIRILLGQKFGRLTVLQEADRAKNKAIQWLCACDCGQQTVVSSTSLASHNTESCGCLVRENNLKHGHTSRHGKPSLTYYSWCAMVARCTNPNNDKWNHYGGANPPVMVDPRWLGEHGFENFLADLGERPPGTTLSRYGDVGDYTPENTTWHTPKQQAAEQKMKRNLQFLDVA